MGTGQSVEVDAHLRKWDAAISELQELCQTNRRMIEQDRLYPPDKQSGQEGGNTTRSVVMDEDLDRSLHGPRRVSSLVSFHNNPQQVGVNGTLSASPMNNSVRRVNGGTTPPDLRSAVGIAGGEGAKSVSSVGGPGPRHNRQQVQEIKKERAALFHSYEVADAEELENVMECSHFGAVAVAMSYLLGGRKDSEDRRTKVTVEDIFFAAQVPLHMLHTGAPHLAMMTDIVREFMDVDNRFKNDYAVEVMHFDIAPTWGQVELGMNDIGDRQAKMLLPEFRKVISHDLEEERNAIRIVNYDPYVLEQAMLVDDDDDDDHGSALAKSVLGKKQTEGKKLQYQKSNEGAYAVIVDCRNAVQLMVTIAEGIVNDSLSVKLTEVPAGSLFKAMMSAEEGRRARGFIRISKKDPHSNNAGDEVPLLFTPELCSGKVLGSTLEGTHASVISHHISPHLAGVAWAIHLLRGVRPNSHNYGTGLPVSDIIRTMQFPVDVYIDGRMQIDKVFTYAREYIARKKFDYTVELYPVLTNISRDDAVPTISVFDLEVVLISVKEANTDPECPQHVMVIMYNANVAHNVINIADEPQWCILGGYDQETQTALLIDARPKTFSRTWTCPLDRLHKAMTTTGYMVFSKNQAGQGQRRSRDSSQSDTHSTSNEPSHVGALPRVAPSVQKHLEILHKQLSLHPVHKEFIKSFAFPKLPIGPTLLAMALSKIGIFTTLNDIMRLLPFEMSSLVIRTFTLESLGVCLRQYLSYKKIKREVDVTIMHGERNCDGKPALSREKFEALLKEHAKDEDTFAILVQFDPEQILIFGEEHPYGRLGLVTSYDEKTQEVTVKDSNPNAYERFWAIEFDTLYNAIQDNDGEGAITNRTRGCITLAHRPTEEVFLEHYRDFRLDLLPVQNIFHVSPSAHIQGLSLAFSQLGHFFSPEEIFYEAYLKTMNDQRRRGSQAFAWRDVDVSLSVINKRIDAAFVTLVCRKFLESRKITNIQVERLEDVDTDDLEEILTAATQNDADHVLILNYDTAKAHQVMGMGRSVALVRGYDPATQIVALMDAEYAVFGLEWRVTQEKLIEIGDLDNVGRSPYGFVQISKREVQPKKKGLGGAPPPDDDDPEGGHKLRRGRDQVAKFV